MREAGEASAFRGDRRYVKYAWVALVVGGAIGVLIYSVELPAALPSVPEQERLVEGIWIGLSLILVGATGFREGQRWAFYFTLAFVPWAIVYEVYQGQEWYLVFSVVAVVLGFRRFFPKVQIAPQGTR